ncbi:hypothetical protein OIU78_027173 [Salix suchowensis]|nr:hypothetical protein OIU78_027173 [Salix suchowensis]
MTPSSLAGQFGDTTYTKVFVGGLAWETQKETMKKYFEQFGEILEAVVITDKATGRSKGYGFVTFREPDAAMRACVDAAPVIDGRRANCNVASLGAQRSKPSTPKHEVERLVLVLSSLFGSWRWEEKGKEKRTSKARLLSFPAAGMGSLQRLERERVGFHLQIAIEWVCVCSSLFVFAGAAGRNFRVMSSFQTGFGGGAGAAFPSAASAFPHYAIHQGLPYNVYGYSSYSPDYTYPTSYYNMYGGAAAQYPVYGTGHGGMMNGAAAAFYPYLQFGEGTGGATSYTASGQSYGVQYPHHLFQYPAINSPTTGGYPQHYGAPMSLAPTAPLPSVCFAVPQA